MSDDNGDQTITVEDGDGTVSILEDGKPVLPDLPAGLAVRLGRDLLAVATVADMMLGLSVLVSKEEGDAQRVGEFGTLLYRKGYMPDPDNGVFYLAPGASTTHGVGIVIMEREPSDIRWALPTDAARKLSADLMLCGYLALMRSEGVPIIPIAPDAAVWSGAGMHVEVPAGRVNGDVPDWDGEHHLWCVFPVHRIADPAALFDTTEGGTKAILDSENLVMIGGPGCIHCEENYSPRLAALPCPGDPSQS